MRIHGWIERADNKHIEFFIKEDGEYEVRAADNDTLAISFEIVQAIAQVAAPLLKETKPVSGWD